MPSTRRCAKFAGPMAPFVITSRLSPSTGTCSKRNVAASRLERSASAGCWKWTPVCSRPRMPWSRRKSRTSAPGWSWSWFRAAPFVRSRNLDLPRHEIKERTTSLLKQAGFRQPLGALKVSPGTDERWAPFAVNATQRELRSPVADGALRMSQADHERALRTLRETVDELEKTNPQEI